MELQGKLLGALLVTYFVSRLVLRLPNPLRKALGITLAHAASLGLIMIALVTLRGTEHASAADQLLLYVSPQIFWWLLDLLREHGLNRGFIARLSRHQAP